MKKRYTIAVDFDGVIHRYDTPYIADGVIPDEPVAGAIAWLAQIAQSFEIVILTTRGRSQSGRDGVRAWLKVRWPGMPDSLVVTGEKVPALIYIDDRGFRFEGTFPTAHEIHQARPWHKKKGA